MYKILHLPSATYLIGKRFATKKEATCYLSELWIVNDTNKDQKNIYDNPSFWIFDKEHAPKVKDRYKVYNLYEFEPVEVD